jgi:hypothetical protein
MNVLIPIHKAKEVGHNLNTSMGLISKCWIEPNFKRAILSLMNDTILTLQDAVKIAEKKNDPQ